MLSKVSKRELTDVVRLRYARANPRDTDHSRRIVHQVDKPSNCLAAWDVSLTL